MTLPPEEAALFVRLHVLLLVYANRALNVVPGVHDVESFTRAPIDGKRQLRDALHAQPSVIDAFISENPANLSPDELELVASFKRAIVGQFCVYRHLKRYSVFLSSDEPPRAYGVLGLNDELADIAPGPPPVLVDAVLVPWRDKIVYDGLILSYNVSFGAGYRRGLDEDYKRAKARYGIIESLAEPQREPSARRRAARSGASAEEILAALGRIEEEVTRLRTPGTTVNQRVLTMLRSALNVAQVTVRTPEDLGEWVRVARRLNSSMNRLREALEMEG